MKNIKNFASVIIILTSFLTAQTIQKDYERAVSFLWDNINNKKVFQLNVDAIWFSDSSAVCYSKTSLDSKYFYKYDFKTKKQEVLIDHKLIADLLKEKFKEDFDEKKLNITIQKVNKNEMIFRTKGKSFLFNYVQKSLKDYTPENINPNEVKSPDGKWIAYTKEYNLYLKSTETNEIKQLSKNGKKEYEYGSYYGWSDIIEGENGERPQQVYINWSPDSRYIQTSICDLQGARKMYLLDFTVDTLYRPQLLSYYRGSPGDKNIVHYIPVLFNLETMEEMQPPIQPIAHENGYNFEWSNQTGIGYFSFMHRGFQKAEFSEYNALTKSYKNIFVDSSKTNLDGYSYYFDKNINSFYFTSERSGWKQIYSVDRLTGNLSEVTNGNYFVNRIVYADKKNLYFIASGNEKGRNIYHQYLYKIDLNGKNLKLLTPENANHELQFSPDYKYFVDNYSTPSMPTITVLRDLNTGKLLQEISKADVSWLKAVNYNPPKEYKVKAADNTTDLYAYIWTPTNFDPSKKYPVIDHSYTGPHTNMIPRTYSRALSINNQALAELGFVVIMIDGRGSANRDRAFKDYSYRRLGYGLGDHIDVMKSIAKDNAWLDIERVGIFGHSAGGYDAARAMLNFPDFYKVSVASAADHDHRMEKAWWPEMYMGWPVDKHYHEQSNVTNAANLKGKLLLVHGAKDENVNPSTTYKLAEKLIEANKEFDLMIFPSQRHGFTGYTASYFLKLRWNYFVKHLLKKEPIWDFKLVE